MVMVRFDFVAHNNGADLLGDQVLMVLGALFVGESVAF